MRIWDLPVDRLCNKHLVAQHFESHCIHAIIVEEQTLSRWWTAPEVERWKGRIPALERKHGETVQEMIKRGFKHKTPMVFGDNGLNIMPDPWQPVAVQIEKLAARCTDCAERLSGYGAELDSTSGEAGKWSSKNREVAGRDVGAVPTSSTSN
jgi:hypothetical protein